MIKFLLLSFISMGISVFSNGSALAAGGDSVGHGGVIWACRDRVAPHALYAGLLSDLFEARVQYGWTLISEGASGHPSDPMEIYAERKLWLQKTLPDFYAALQPRMAYVETHKTLIEAELLSTADFNNAIKPEASKCPVGDWLPLNIANFREEDQQILISQELWQSPKIASLDKAALLVHEAVYYWMRTYYGATDSDKSRKITGLLFSTLPAEQIKSEIAKILGSYPDHPEGKFVCTMKNSKRNQIYVAFADDQEDASLTVRERCQDDADANWCERSSIACEAIVAEPHHRCIAENSTTRKIYTGEGRNLLEAEFNAHMACYVGTQAQGASPQQCPDFEFMECD